MPRLALYLLRILTRYGIVAAVTEAMILRLLHQRDAARNEVDRLRGITPPARG